MESFGGCAPKRFGAQPPKRFGAAVPGRTVKMNSMIGPRSGMRPIRAVYPERSISWSLRIAIEKLGIIDATTKSCRDH
ncbi:hypothetical protein AXFE_28910 [Acidithrix ferrooxidans]|uniref:Uncharacterized protein n=1 Tax=Acidithrix ferrooxidans TaxID=1280514 RepID=A0A0D8HGP6_9ACTN|nr:hypothetical protein AXFE_28910 [Acidithrix ferrooxidans]